MSRRKKIFDIIQIGDKSNVISRVFDFFIVCVILLNISALFLETFDELAVLHPVFRGIEIVTTLIFCVEYILRIWTADLLYPEDGKVKSRLHFLISYDGIVDLFTILPAFFLTGFVVFRMLRVVRIFHLFRLNAKYDSFNVITSVLKEKRNQILSSLCIIFVLMLASSLCMYSVEHEAQPDVFTNAFSGMWWAVSTVLTVGYGDIYPITPLGQVMAICFAFLGVGAVAIPTGIISAGFVAVYTKEQNEMNYREKDIADIVEVFVDEKLANRSVQELNEEERLEVYLIIRDEMTVLPQPATILRRGDIIVAKMIGERE